jgi:hypothetical protein
MSFGVMGIGGLVDVPRPSAFAAGPEQYLGNAVSTASPNFQDVFGGFNLTVAVAGNYECEFEGEINGTNASTEEEISISVNGGNQVNAERFNQGNGQDVRVTYTSIRLIGLSVGDLVTGTLRKSAGPGNAQMTRRRIKLTQVG